MLEYSYLESQQRGEHTLIVFSREMLAELHTHEKTAATSE